jgi:hypothetical protein
LISVIACFPSDCPGTHSRGTGIIAGPVARCAPFGQTGRVVEKRWRSTAHRPTNGHNLFR